jgi:GrpB-like predicted nucleotidyltransferase (UPF0157 family)
VTGPEQWPRWATEPVEVVDHDPRWLPRGELVANRLDRLLAGWLTRTAEHIGSTAVPGLAAKPIIDVQAAVGDFSCAPLVADVLAPEGWHFVPAELDQRPWRRFFVLVEKDRRVAHLHLMIDGSQRWDDQLGFRDALRNDADLRSRYARTKQELASRHTDDREAYTRGKAAFVATVAGSGGHVGALGALPGRQHAVDAEPTGTDRRDQQRDHGDQADELPAAALDEDTVADVDEEQGADHVQRDEDRGHRGGHADEQQ